MSWLTMKVLNYRGWPENRHNFLFARFLCLLLEIAYCLIITYACSITSPLPLVPHHFDWQVGPSFCWCSPSTPLVCSCDWPVTCQSLCLQHASMLRDSTVRMSLNVPEEFSSMSDSMFTLFRCFVTDGCVSYEAWLKRDERCWMLLVSADKVGHVSVQKNLRGWHPLTGEAAQWHGHPVLHHVHFDYDESWHIFVPAKLNGTLPTDP